MALQVAGIPISIEPSAHQDDGLGVKCVSQLWNQWCWAACTTMVLRFYGNSVDQCQVASWLLHEKSCCNGSDSCNCACIVKAGRDDVNDIYVNFGGFNPSRATKCDGPISSPDLKAELATRPVEVGIDQGGGSGHLMIVYGCLDGGNLFFVHDPDGCCAGAVTYEQLRSNDLNQPWVKTWTNLYP